MPTPTSQFSPSLPPSVFPSPTPLNPEPRTLNSPFPPTGRDFIVYQRIVVDHASTWTVAEELHLSQTRVRQIVKKIIHWLAHTLPADNELADAAALRLGKHIAADRLQRYLVEADRLWKETGQTKFVNLCLRIIEAQSKIPAFPGSLESLAADAIDGPLPDEVGWAAPTNAKTERQGDGEIEVKRDDPVSPLPHTSLPPSASPPPLRDFSTTSTPAAKAHENVTPSIAACACTKATSSDLPPATAAARKAFLAPAHQPSTPGDDSPVTQINIKPDHLGFPSTPTRSVSGGSMPPTRSVSKGRLSRRDRRRLKRKLGA